MSASNPYAAKGPKPTTSQEVEPELDNFLRRLEALGASHDELDQVEATWDQFDEDWTPKRRAELVRADDGELLAMIRESRREYDEGTTTEEEQAERDEEVWRAGLLEDARKAAEGTVAEALAWVGSDPDRAAAVLAVEVGPEGDRRSTLVKPLRELVAEARK